MKYFPNKIRKIFVTVYFSKFYFYFHKFSKILIKMLQPSTIAQENKLKDH